MTIYCSMSMVRVDSLSWTFGADSTNNPAANLDGGLKTKIRSGI